jgi:hypothetical protein
MFYSFLQSGNVRLIQRIDAYLSFERIKVRCKNVRLSKEEKWYVIKQIRFNSFITWECK